MNCKIDIKGIAPGEHRYDFHIDRSLFEVYENDTVSEADIEASALLVKGAGCFRLTLEITGTVTVACDRCLADLDIPVEVEQSFVVRFPGGAEEDEDVAEDEIMMGQDASELDLSQVIYDYVCTSLPIRKVHEDGKCDPEMMEKMKDILK